MKLILSDTVRVNIAYVILARSSITIFVLGLVLGSESSPKIAKCYFFDPEAYSIADAPTTENCKLLPGKTQLN